MARKVESQGAKPTGFVGKVTGKLMNFFHTKHHMQIINKLVLTQDDEVLDIGCGGGKVIDELAKRISHGKIYGIDHSQEMIDLSTKVNSNHILQGKVDIRQGSVLSMPYADEKFNLITALETIQFWPELEHACKEVFRVLKTGGTFLIINRFPKEGTKWWQFAQLKSALDYKSILHTAGFHSLVIDLTTSKDWIIVKGKR